MYSLTEILKLEGENDNILIELDNNIFLDVKNGIKYNLTEVLQILFNNNIKKIDFRLFKNLYKQCYKNIKIKSYNYKFYKLKFNNYKLIRRNEYTQDTFNQYLILKKII